MKRWLPYLFFFTIGIGVIGFFYLNYLQYRAWFEIGPPASYLIPPYQSVWYLIGYTISRYAQPYFISLGVAFIFLGLAIFLNELFGRRFFEDEEPYLGAFFIFILGSPLWIYYLATILIIGVIGSLIMSFSLRFSENETSLSSQKNNFAARWLKKTERFSLYPFWLPAAAITLIISKILF